MLKFLHHHRPEDAIQRDLRSLPDRLWLDYLLRQQPIPAKFAGLIPQMPDEKVQLHFTGASGRVTLLQSLDFMNLAKSCIRRQKIRDLSDKKLLDFGCGWGRITRMFLKLIPAANITGVDPMPEMIALCKENLPGVNFLQTQPAPPIPEFADQSFDLITAYSVFSHLNEEYLNLWFAEFARILKPGGLMFITTRSRSFINHLEKLRGENDYAEYATQLRDCFTDTASAFAAYDQGLVIHQPVGGGSLSTSFYGETCVPRAYFSRFSKDFEILDFVANMKYEDNQSCVILRNR